MLEIIKERYNRLNSNDDIYASGTLVLWQFWFNGVLVTADTGFANEDNMRYLHTKNINGYMPDNQFRSRDPKFYKQKEKFKRTSLVKPGATKIMPASEFNFDPVNLFCCYPADKQLHEESKQEDKQGKLKAQLIPTG